jgi:hypothetical protein
MQDLERPDGRVERRAGTRNEVLTSLGRLLESVRREAEFEAVAVADETGILVAGAGAWARCQELAAASSLARPSYAANDTVPTRADVLARRMEVRRLMVDGVQVLLSGSGGKSSAPEALTRAAAGCARILGRSRR